MDNLQTAIENEFDLLDDIQDDNFEAMDRLRNLPNWYLIKTESTED